MIHACQHILQFPHWHQHYNMEHYLPRVKYVCEVTLFAEIQPYKNTL